MQTTIIIKTFTKKKENDKIYLENERYIIVWDRQMTVR